MKISTFFLFTFSLLFASALTSCIGDDVILDEVDPVVRIENPIDTLGLDTEYRYEATFFNKVGLPESTPITWTSSAPEVVTIDQDGVARAVALGDAIITASAASDSGMFQDIDPIAVGENTVNNAERSGTIRTTSSYKLTGDFVIQDNGSGGVRIIVADNYDASTSLPGLYLYLTNNPNTTSGALEIGKVQTFNGAHEYTVDNVSLFDYSHLLYFCKPFNVKVGDGTIN